MKEQLPGIEGQRLNTEYKSPYPKGSGLEAGAKLQKNQAQNTETILKQPMVKYLPKRDVFNMVLISVARAFADLNVKDISETDRGYLVNELTDNIIKRYPAIRLSEIPDAIALGVRGKYGEFYGLSVIAFERFIEQYLLSARRTEMVRQVPADDQQRTAPDLQTQFNTAKYNTMQALQRRQKGSDIETIASSVYTFLDRLKLIEFTRSEKMDLLTDAVRELINELKFKLILACMHERADIKNNIQAYKKAITEQAPLNDQQFNLAVLRSKKLALDAFLNNIILHETDLEALVESKKALFMGDEK